MALRRLLRGQIDLDRLEAIAREVTECDDQPAGRVEFLEANNWLSTPFVIDDRYFVKAISRQHSLVHTLLTTGRNLGAYASGSEGFFEHVASPIEMAERELAATRRMRDLGINVPRPVRAFEFDGLGVLVMEYIPEFETLDDADPDTVDGHAEELFQWLTEMHQAGFAHGDLRAENVLISRGELYFIDATCVDEDNVRDARAYDVACALAVLEPILGAHRTVEAAATVCDRETLVTASGFLDFVNIRPDHSFDVLAVKGELAKATTG